MQATRGASGVTWLARERRCGVCARRRHAPITASPSPGAPPPSAGRAAPGGPPAVASMKSKFTTLDVAAVAAHLRASVVGMRVLNVYDAPGTHKVRGQRGWGRGCGDCSAGRSVAGPRAASSRARRRPAPNAAPWRRRRGRRRREPTTSHLPPFSSGRLPQARAHGRRRRQGVPAAGAGRPVPHGGRAADAARRPVGVCAQAAQARARAPPGGRAAVGV